MEVLGEAAIYEVIEVAGKFRTHYSVESVESIDMFGSRESGDARVEE